MTTMQKHLICSAFAALVSSATGIGCEFVVAVDRGQISASGAGGSDMGGAAGVAGSGGDVTTDSNAGASGSGGYDVGDGAPGDQVSADEGAEAADAARDSAPSDGPEGGAEVHDAAVEQTPPVDADAGPPVGDAAGQDALEEDADDNGSADNPGGGT
jgi:hypothetical protein